MDSLYNRIEDLCKEKGVNITQMCREAKVPRATLSELKMRRTVMLSPKNLEKLSAYFNVSVDTLLGNEQKKTPTPEGERDVENERILDAIEKTDPATREVVLRLLGIQ